jgi:hypothetical protein
MAGAIRDGGIATLERKEFKKVDRRRTVLLEREFAGRGEKPRAAEK